MHFQNLRIFSCAGSITGAMRILRLHPLPGRTLPLFISRENISNLQSGKPDSVPGTRTQVGTSRYIQQHTFLYTEKFHKSSNQFSQCKSSIIWANHR